MNKLTKCFEQKQKDILNIYFTAGFPKKEDTQRILKSLNSAGVDIIEIGMPYSDPLADGPTIQESGATALKQGMHLDLLFEQIAEVSADLDAALILMGYYNQVLQYGPHKFFTKCKAVGVDSLIIPDLPLFEYEELYKDLFEELDLGISFLITPQTQEARISEIDRLSNGFIYMVSSASITGAKSGISQEQIEYFNRINKMSLSNPRLIGFGISDHDTFMTACQYASGAIIGSAFIRSLKEGENLEKGIIEFVESIKLPLSN